MIEKNLTKYKVCVAVYKEINRSFNRFGWHRHHIKPKSLYPELADDPRNIVAVPDIVHWALHKWLLEHYRETGNHAAAEKMEKVDLETYINDNLKKTKFDFSASSKILEHLEEALSGYVNVTRRLHRNLAVIYGGTSDRQTLKIWVRPGFEVPKALESVLVEGDSLPRVCYLGFGKGFRLSRDHLDLAMKNLELATTVSSGRIKALGLKEVKRFEEIDEVFIKRYLADFHDHALERFGRKTVDELDIPGNYLDDYIELMSATNPEPKSIDEIWHDT